MRRRDFITVMGGATAAWPLTATWPFVASAEPGRAVIGLVSIGASPDDPANFRPFLQQMAELGYTDGRNVKYERRFAAGNDSLVEGFIADLVRRQVDIIVVTGTRETIAAKRATSSIPIVTFLHPDVIGAGLAQSLSRPGGNLTGLTTLDTDLYGKRLQIFKQAVPNLTRAGVLVSGRQPAYARGSSWEHSFQEAARSLKIELEIAEADERNLEPVLDTLAARGVQGLVVTSDGVYVAQAKALAEGALKYRLPTMFVYRRQVQAGGLMAYAARTPDLSRRAAFFVDRIIKGAKPADLPVEQPIHFELIINLKTARVLGLEPSATLLALADEVID
jgi:putative tryptophan/tyrosine transport system substrate-binding protein